MEKTTSLSVGMMQKKSKGLMRGIFMNWIMDFDDRCHKLIDGGGSELETESVGEAEKDMDMGIRLLSGQRMIRRISQISGLLR